MCVAETVVTHLSTTWGVQVNGSVSASPGSALRNEAEADQRESRESRTGAKVLLSRGLEYTVEECTCEDCVKNKSKVDSDHSFPLPAMEEGATILVTTKTNDYCNSLVASVTEMERSIFTR